MCVVPKCCIIESACFPLYPTPCPLQCVIPPTAIVLPSSFMLVIGIYMCVWNCVSMLRRAPCKLYDEPRSRQHSAVECCAVVCVGLVQLAGFSHNDEYI